MTPILVYTSPKGNLIFTDQFCCYTALYKANCTLCTVFYLAAFNQHVFGIQIYCCMLSVVFSYCFIALYFVTISQSVYPNYWIMLRAFGWLPVWDYYESCYYKYSCTCLLVAVSAHLCLVYALEYNCWFVGEACVEL